MIEQRALTQIFFFQSYVRVLVLVKLLNEGLHLLVVPRAQGQEHLVVKCIEMPSFPWAGPVSARPRQSSRCDLHPAIRR